MDRVEHVLRSTGRGGGRGATGVWAMPLSLSSGHQNIPTHVVRPRVIEYNNDDGDGDGDGDDVDENDSYNNTADFNSSRFAARQRRSATVRPPSRVAMVDRALLDTCTEQQAARDTLAHQRARQHQHARDRVLLDLHSSSFHSFNESSATSAAASARSATPLSRHLHRLYAPTASRAASPAPAPPAPASFGSSRSSSSLSSSTVAVRPRSAQLGLASGERKNITLHALRDEEPVFHTHRFPREHASPPPRRSRTPSAQRRRATHASHHSPPPTSTPWYLDAGARESSASRGNNNDNCVCSPRTPTHGHTHAPAPSTFAAGASPSRIAFEDASERRHTAPPSRSSSSSAAASVATAQTDQHVRATADRVLAGRRSATAARPLSIRDVLPSSALTRRAPWKSWRDGPGEPANKPVRATLSPSRARALSRSPASARRAARSRSKSRTRSRSGARRGDIPTVPTLTAEWPDHNAPSVWIGPAEWRRITLDGRTIGRARSRERLVETAEDKRADAVARRLQRDQLLMRSRLHARIHRRHAMDRAIEVAESKREREADTAEQRTARQRQLKEAADARNAEHVRRQDRLLHERRGRLPSYMRSLAPIAHDMRNDVLVHPLREDDTAYESFDEVRDDRGAEREHGKSGGKSESLSPPSSALRGAGGGANAREQEYHVSGEVEVDTIRRRRRQDGDADDDALPVDEELEAELTEDERNAAMHAAYAAAVAAATAAASAAANGHASTSLAPSSTSPSGAEQARRPRAHESGVSAAPQLSTSRQSTSRSVNLSDLVRRLDDEMNRSVNTSVSQRQRRANTSVTLAPAPAHAPAPIAATRDDSARRREDAGTSRSTASAPLHPATAAALDSEIHAMIEQLKLRKRDRDERIRQWREQDEALKAELRRHELSLGSISTATSVSTGSGGGSGGVPVSATTGQRGARAATSGGLREAVREPLRERDSAASANPIAVDNLAASVEAQLEQAREDSLDRSVDTTTVALQNQDAVLRYLRDRSGDISVRLQSLSQA